jgi:hypothetical protein
MASQLFSNFDAEMGVSLGYLNSGGNALRLGVSTTKMAYFNGQKALWDPLYLAYKDPLTKEETQKDIEDLFKTFNQDMEDNKETLKSNTDITLTGTDILKLFIHIDAARRNYVAVPNIAPVNSCTKYAVGVNKVYAGNPTEGHITDKHLPDDVAKIGRAIAYVPHYQPAPTRDKYTTISSVGSTSFDILVATINRHMVCYIITWYINNRGDFGGESDPFNFDTV